MAAEDSVMTPQDLKADDDLAGGSVEEASSSQADKEVDLTADGGLRKRILVPGEGWETPEKSDEVTVHYVGTLEDGSEFDSSRGRNDPFKFTLGQGQVIKGWDEGVATMKKGEKAMLICRSDYAYGDRGSPPKIGPGATLHFEVELLSWKSNKDLTGDGGIIKTTTREGEGWDHAKNRDEVVVKYEVRLKDSGEVVAASPADGESFPLPAPRPLRGFADAVKAMKKGEAARLIVRNSDYGFEAAERPANVPEDAMLEADLELVAWSSVEDVTPDGGVVKKTLTEGSEWKKPNQGASVKAHVVGRLQDGAVFEDADLDFVTDEEQVPEGLDLAVQKMKRGETAEVTLAPRYAFGAEGAQRSSGAVPPDASVTYTVELKEFENAKEPWSMSDEEKLEAAQRRKEKGNAQFKAGKWAAALAKYKSASDLADQAGKDKEGLKAEARDVRKSALLNQAACHLKLGANRDAISAADKVLEKDGSNVKALYRRAQAYLALADYVECETDIKRALVEDPKNVGVRLLQREYKQKSAESRKKDKALFSRMFKPSKDTPATPVASAADVDMAAENGEAEATTTAAQGPGTAEPMEAEATAAGGSATNGHTS